MNNTISSFIICTLESITEIEQITIKNNETFFNVSVNDETGSVEKTDDTICHKKKDNNKKEAKTEKKEAWKQKTRRLASGMRIALFIKTGVTGDFPVNRGDRRRK